MPAERRERVGEGDEVARNQPRALVNQLVERVLPVGAGLAPVDRAGVVRRPARRRASRACRCSPSSTAAGRPGSASGSSRTAAPPPSGRRRSRCTRPSAAPSAPAGSARTARCGSARPSGGSRRASRGSGPARWRSSWRGRSPSPSSTGRPPSPRTRTCSPCRCRRRRPSRHSSRRRRSASPRPSRRRRGPPSDQSRALCALVIVSSVVNVFDDTMKSVSAGSRSRVASTRSMPSTFDTNRKVIERSL